METEIRGWRGPVYLMLGPGNTLIMWLWTSLLLLYIFLVRMTFFLFKFHFTYCSCFSIFLYICVSEWRVKSWGNNNVRKGKQLLFNASNMKGNHKRFFLSYYHHDRYFGYVIFPNSYLSNGILCCKFCSHSLYQFYEFLQSPLALGWGRMPYLLHSIISTRVFYPYLYFA